MSKQGDARSTKKRSKQRVSYKGACKNKSKIQAKNRREKSLKKQERDKYAQKRGIFLLKQRIDAEKAKLKRKRTKTEKAPKRKARNTHIRCSK